MLSLTIARDDLRPLRDQIVVAIKREIEGRRLHPGARLPSIRQLADAHAISRFTVVEAYDQLVAMGYVEARRGVGFYTASLAGKAGAAGPTPPGRHAGNEELVGLIRRLLEADDGAILAGGPWLPNAWLEEAGLRQSLRTLARRNDARLHEYGHPFGYLPLRDHLVQVLDGIGVAAHPGQILLTQGTSQALELVIRHLVKPGDAVLVDDPGYYNMFGNLRLLGADLLPVPRLPDGPDVNVLAGLAAIHRPRLYITQSAMQNPTGTDMSARIAHRVLQVAEQYDLFVMEDDIFCDLQAEPTPRLATLDQLNRVIYVRSFSKTLSGSIRVGFIACAADIASQLADIKMLTSITTSQFAEQLIYQILVDGHYRKYIVRLRDRLAEARADALHHLETIGLELFVQPAGGMFAWARLPGVEDSLPLASAALRDRIVLAPGTVFRPNLGRSPWMRFNVTACTDPRVSRWLRQYPTNGDQG